MTQICIEPGCKVRSSFNIKGEKKGLYCGKHKKEGMVDVNNPICIECDTRAGFNNKGQTKGLYCSKHKKEGMVDVKHKTCIECGVIPIFNIKGEKKGLYCALHKKENMIDVTNKTCLDCDKQAAFNIKGEKKGLYCAGHKKEDMVDIRNITCLECDKHPAFNTKGEKYGLYCGKHKKDGMVDVKSRTCLECDTQQAFNIKGEKRGLYCGKHKKEDMVDVKNTTCIECDTIPCFNIKGQKKALFCVEHKKEGMVDVRHNALTCKSEWCSTRVRTETNDGYCLHCYMHLFPDKPTTRNYKTKEYAVVEFIKMKFPHLQWIADKTIQNGCSKRRPDLLLDLGYQIIIVEIDENQHADYDCSCENKRLMELSKDLGHISIVFIRFNPDEYEKNGASIKSCWGSNGNGIVSVKKNKEKEWSERLNALEESIIYWIDPANVTNKTIELVPLFYDS